MRQLAILTLALAGWALPSVSATETNRFVIHRNAWSFNQSELQWYEPGKVAQQKLAGTLGTVGPGGSCVAGWAEYDFEMPVSGWYELWEQGGVWGWPRDVYLDGALLFQLVESHPDDVARLEYKEANLYLKAGRHSLRFRRLGFPGILPGSWELRAADGDASGCIRATEVGQNVVRAGTKVRVVFTGGTCLPTAYELFVRDEETRQTTAVGRLEFPATAMPVQKTTEIEFPSQGVFVLLARSGGKVLRPADLKAGRFIAIDTKHPPVPAAELKTTPVVDIDCVAQTIGGRAVEKDQTFWEKDGATRVVVKPFGKYRESSGQGISEHWATDGFSYKFDLPDCTHTYRLRVDYPDDTRRSMGFWINDGADLRGGVPLTGGVETGDHYTLTQKPLTHEAFFYPRNATGLVVAVLNLVPGCKAAATRIRIDRVDSALPGAPISTPKSPIPNRLMGFYFEESGRWTRFFGAESVGGVNANLVSLDRWGQWNRYLGANLMFPTINVYQDNRYPSRILDGYFNASEDETRMLALMAEKYGSQFVPEFHLSGQTWFDKQVMGVWTEESEQNGKKIREVKFTSPQAEEYVIRDRDGALTFGWKEWGYNALHPKIQEMYINVFGELADRLGDCASFAGISSRLMLGWQWQGWNALPGLNWGYDDWTVAQFTKDTGIKVPGVAGDPKRFRQRFDFLTSGAPCERWMDWRCKRLFDFHCRLRDRIRKAKPDAKLFFTYYGPDPREAYSKEMLGQMREIGMDWRLYANEPGMVIIPSGSYGRRYSTPIADAAIAEPLFDGDLKTVARLGDRGFLLYGSYYEVNDNLDWSKLGGKPGMAFDSCAPAGVNERELYAITLADSDSSFILNGANGWIFGTPGLMQPFLREYRALPAVHFTAFDKARDPVAVWYLDDLKSEIVNLKSHYFYAVNRLPVPVRVTLTLSGWWKTVTPAAGGETVKLDGDEFSFTLEPFMLRSFKATGWGVKPADCRTEVPPEFVAKLAPLMEFARQLRADVAARRVAVELSEREARAVIGLLDESLRAYQEKRFWQARGNLERVALVRLYDMIGRYPPGLFERAKPHGFLEASMVPTPDTGKAVFIGDVRGRLAAVNDLTYDAHSNLWVASAQQVMNLTGEGKYLRSLRLVQPHLPDPGDARWSHLANPSYLVPPSLRITPEGTLMVTEPNGISERFDMLTGRLLGQATGVREGPGRMVVTPDGTWGFDIVSGGYGVAGLVRQTNGNLVKAWTQALSARVAALALSPEGRLAVGFREESGGVVARDYAWSVTGLEKPRDLVRGLKEIETQCLNGFTQLKVHDGKLFFGAHGKLMRLTPGTPDMVEAVFDPLWQGRPFEAFGFAPDGELYLASHMIGASRGVNLYRCAKTEAGWARPEYLNEGKSLSGEGWYIVPSDLEVDAQGRVILRLFNQENKANSRDVTLFRWSPDGTREKVFTLGNDFEPYGYYGLHLAASGKLYLAGGTTRKVACLSPAGQLLWQSRYEVPQGPDSVPWRQPLGITTDRQGRVWLTEPARNQVVCLDPTGKFLKAYGHFGTIDDRTGEAFCNPAGIATIKDAAGVEWLYIADVGNQRLVKWRLP